MAMAYCTPLAVHVMDIGAKPIDLPLSYGVLLWAILSLCLGHKISRRIVIALCVFSLFPLLGALSSILLGGTLSPIFASMSFSLPVAHLLSGAMIAIRCNQSPLIPFGRALALVIVVLTISDLGYGEFPRGCGYEGRWGGCLGPLSVYGFPNASMNFLVSFAPLLTLLYARANGTDKALALVAVALLIAIVPMSLSRSATVLLLIPIGVFLWQVAPRTYPILLACGAFVLVMGTEYLTSTFLGQGLARRIEVAIENEDLLGGRGQIWREAWATFSTSPAVGSGFQYFSEYSEFGTVHQQYLEVLFKAGVFGFLIYYGFFIFVLWRSWKIVQNVPRPTRVVSVVVVSAVILSILISSLFQSLISYQVVGNIIFFLCGYVLQKNIYHETSHPRFIQWKNNVG